MQDILLLDIVYLIMIGYAATALEGRVNHSSDGVVFFINLFPFCLVLLLFSFPLYQLGASYFIINLIATASIGIAAQQVPDTNAKAVIAVCFLTGISMTLLFFL